MAMKSEFFLALSVAKEFDAVLCTASASSCPSVWSGLPAFVHTTPNIDSFVSYLKTYLYWQSFMWPRFCAFGIYLAWRIVTLHYITYIPKYIHCPISIQDTDRLTIRKTDVSSAGRDRERLASPPLRNIRCPHPAPKSDCRRTSSVSANTAGACPRAVRPSSCLCEERLKPPPPFLDGSDTSRIAKQTVGNDRHETYSLQPQRRCRC